MTKTSFLAAALLATSLSVAHAQTPPAPAEQGDASVGKNLSKHPDNKGLQTADKKVDANDAKAAAKRAEAKEERKEDAKKDRKEDKRERKERQEKHERMERPAKAERPGH